MASPGSNPGCLGALRRAWLQLWDLSVRIRRRVPRTLLLPLLALLVTGILFIIVGPVFTSFMDEGQQTDEDVQVYCALEPFVSLDYETGDYIYEDIPDEVCPEYYELEDDEVSWDDGPTAIYVKIHITNLALEAGTASLLAQVFYAGDYAGARNTFKMPKNMTGAFLLLGTQNITLAGGMLYMRQDFSVNLTPEIALFSYPFDKFTASLFIQAYGLMDDGSETMLPLVVEMRKALPTFSLAVQAQLNSTWVSDEETLVTPTLTITRSKTTKFFSVFIVISMWALSSYAFAHALDIVYLRPRQVLIDDAAFIASLLYALPSVRTVQPAVPAIGAAVDVIGFFWNMALTTLSGLMVLAGLHGWYRHGRSQRRGEAGEEVAKAKVTVEANPHYQQNPGVEKDVEAAPAL